MVGMAFSGFAGSADNIGYVIPCCVISVSVSVCLLISVSVSVCLLISVSVSVCLFAGVSMSVRQFMCAYECCTLTLFSAELYQRFQKER